MSRVLRNPGVSIRINVQGGTLGDKFLCESCQHATVMRGGSMKQISVRCSAEEGFPVTVPFRVVQCNRYQETDTTNLRRMKHEAYYIHKTSHGGVHVVTFAQFEDYDFLRSLEKSDARTQLKTMRVAKKSRSRPKVSTNRKERSN